MKKMVTLFLLPAIMATAAAQPGQSGTFAPSHKGPVAKTVSASATWEPTYVFTLRQRNKAIARINRIYNRKIQRERNRLFVGRYEKARRVNQLLRQRDFEVHKINARFNSPRNEYHRRHRHYRHG